VYFKDIFILKKKVNKETCKYVFYWKQFTSFCGGYFPWPSLKETVPVIHFFLLFGYTYFTLLITNSREDIHKNTCKTDTVENCHVYDPCDKTIRLFFV